MIHSCISHTDNIFFVCKDSNNYQTGKIYFHFDGENDGGDGWDDEGIGEGDGVCLLVVMIKGERKVGGT